MKPEEFPPNVKARPHRISKTAVVFRCKMVKFPVNLDDVTNGHKLQGMSKDIMIVTFCPKGGMTEWTKRWSTWYRVGSINLMVYLFEPIDLKSC